MTAKKSVRQHARERGALDGADAQALEAALTMTERERDEWRQQHENALASWQADMRALKTKQDAGLAALATRLNLFLLADFDPYYAIGLDIGRLQGFERLWSQACEIARTHCPVDTGLSHIREGIPALAKRAESAELDCAKWRKVAEANTLLRGCVQQSGYNVACVCGVPSDGDEAKQPVSQWDGGELPLDNEFHSIRGTFSPVELIDLPVNPTINMNEDSIKNRKQAIAEWMTRGNNYYDHKDKSLCSYCGHPANSSTCQKSHA